MMLKHNPCKGCNMVQCRVNNEACGDYHDFIADIKRDAVSAHSFRSYIPGQEPDGLVIVRTEGGQVCLASYDALLKKWTAPGGIPNLEKDKVTKWTRIPE